MVELGGGLATAAEALVAGNQLTIVVQGDLAGADPRATRSPIRPTGTEYRFWRIVTRALESTLGLAVSAVSKGSAGSQA